MNGVKVWEPYEVRCEFDGEDNRNLLAVVKVGYDLRSIKFEPMTFDAFAKNDGLHGFDIGKINEMNNLPLNEKIDFYLNMRNHPMLFLSMNLNLRLTYVYYENGTNVMAKRPISWEEYLTIPEDDFETRDEKYLYEKYFGYKA